MDKRIRERHLFLAEKGWEGWEITNLAGDASPRKYFRLSKGGKTAVLMDAPINSCGPLEPFIKISGYLIELGLSAPHILAKDLPGGFLILEDLGNDLFSTILLRDQEIEIKIYLVALDILIALREKALPPNIPAYTPKIQGELASLSLKWYAQNILDVEVPKEDISQLEIMVSAAVASLDEKQVFIHRDYHAENLLWLPDRSDLKRVGIIDFQDGARGQSSYDLVSLVEDARRDISQDLKKILLERYSKLTGEPLAKVEKGVAISGIQRNLRIIGVFARLAARDSKTWYVDYIPRVWIYLMGDLEVAGLSELTSFIMNNLPQPTSENLAKLRSN